MTSRHDLADAHHRIGAYIRQTPLLDLGAEEILPVPVSAKLEMTQHTGSFKPRGAFNAMLFPPPARRRCRRSSAAPICRHRAKNRGGDLRR